MNMVYGYCRISTQKQSMERQVRNITTAYPAAIIYQEAYTGTKLEGREKLEKLLKTVKAGDTIVFDSVSRMSRNADEGFQLYKRLMENGIELVFLKEPQINTATYKAAMDKQISIASTGDSVADDLIQSITAAINRYMMSLAERQIRIAFEQSEKEVSDLQQRTREGIETARRNGKQIGQQEGRKLNVKKAAPAMELIKKHSKDFCGSLNDQECMKLTGLARNTYYKYKREIRAALELTEQNDYKNTLNNWESSMDV